MLGPTGSTISVAAAGEGPVLFLLHAFPLNLEMWTRQLEDLSDQFQVLAIDYRGFGKSTLDDDAYTISDLADDIEWVRRHLARDKKLTLCGISMGGYVALEYWSRHEQCVEGLILSNTNPDSDDTAARERRFAAAETARRDGAMAAVGGLLPKLTSAAPSSSVQEQLKQWAQSCPGPSIAAAQQAMAGRTSFRERLPQIKVPSLVLTGEEDSLAPVDASEDWGRLLPDSQFATIGQTAHLPPLERPEVFNERIREFRLRLGTSPNAQ